MQLNKHHQELDEHGVGKCSVPMWWGYGMPAGFCDKPAYGNQLETCRYRDINGNLHRAGDRPITFSLACPAHGGPETPTNEETKCTP